jgi:hypothetical protein
MKIVPYFELFSYEILPEVKLLDQRALLYVGYENAFLKPDVGCAHVIPALKSLR